MSCDVRMESAFNEERISKTSHEGVDDQINEQANERDDDLVDDDQTDDHDDDLADEQTKDQADNHKRTHAVDHDDVKADEQTKDQADDHKSSQADEKDDDRENDTAIEKRSKQQTTSSDIASSQNSTTAITQQPKSSIKTPSTKHSGDPTDIHQHTLPSTGVSDINLDVELAIEPGTCLSASAGVGSASKDLCNGFTNLECRYPNVGCDLSCACDGGLQLVSECTMELCSANCILGCLGFSLGLALDTKATWNQDGVEFEILGTGIETSQGKVLRFLGSGIGIIDGEKREIMLKKRKVKEARQAQKNAEKEKAAREKDKIIKEAVDLEETGKDNTAAEIEDDGGESPQASS